MPNDDRVRTKISETRIILEAIDDNLSIAIAANAMFKAAAYDAKMTEVFHETVEAWGFNEILSAEQFNVIVSLIRIFDDRDDVDSLPQLMAIIADQEVLDALRGDAANRAADHEPYFQQPVSDEDRRWLIEESRNRRRASDIANFEKWSGCAREKFKKLKGSHILASLRKYRHEVLAHTARHDTVKTLPKNHFAEDLLSRTVELVKFLQLALTGSDPDYDGTMEMWDEQASKFWDLVVKGRDRRG